MNALVWGARRALSTARQTLIETHELAVCGHSMWPWRMCRANYRHTLLAPEVLLRGDSCTARDPLVSSVLGL